MLRTLLVLVSLISIFMSAPAGAQPPAAERSPALTRDAQAITLLNQCATAMGSPIAQSTFLASGHLVPANTDDPPMAVTVRSKGDTQLRWDRSLADGQESLVFQRGGGSIKRGDHQSRMAPWLTEYSRPEHFPALVCGSELQRQGMDILYVGLENVGSSTVHHIRVSAAARGQSQRADAARRLMSEFHIYLDPTSSFVWKTKRFAFSPDALENRSDLETYYTDYRQVNGVWMPFTLAKYLDGQKLHDVTFDSVELGVALSDADFSN